MKPLKRLGQHFLTDPDILRRIVDALDPQPDDVVLEIGPGKGSLTEQLVSRVGRVIAIEKDRRLAEELRARYGVKEVIIERKEAFSRPATQERIDALAKRVQVAAAAVGG